MSTNIYETYNMSSFLQVKVTSKKVFVYAPTSSESTSNFKYEKTPIITFNYIKVFIPEGKNYDKDEDKFYSNKNNEGNKILLQLNKNEYVLIGGDVFKFKSESEINKFESIIINGEETGEPYAFDQKGNLYFFNEKAIIKSASVPKKIKNGSEYEVIEWFRYTKIKKQELHYESLFDKEDLEKYHIKNSPVKKLSVKKSPAKKSTIKNMENSEIIEEMRNLTNNLRYQMGIMANILEHLEEKLFKLENK